MLKEIVIVFQAWGKANYFIKNYRSWRWMIVPGIVYSLLFVAAMVVFWWSEDEVVTWMSNRLHIFQLLKESGNAWLNFLFIMSGIMLRLTLLMVYFSVFKYFILIVGAPLFAYLSEKTEATITGNQEALPTRNNIIRKSLRSIKLDLRNCLWQSLYLLPLVVISVIPVVGWIAPIVAIMIECYYFGFSMLDFSLERQGFTPAESIRYIGRHKGFAIANGLVFYMLHFVIVLAPAFAIITATFTIKLVKK